MAGEECRLPLWLLLPLMEPRPVSHRRAPSKAVTLTGRVRSRGPWETLGDPGRGRVTGTSTLLRARSSWRA